MLRAFEELCSWLAPREEFANAGFLGSSPPSQAPGAKASGVTAAGPAADGCSALLNECVGALVLPASSGDESDWSLERVRLQLMPAPNPLALQLLVGHLFPRLICAFHEHRSSPSEWLVFYVRLQTHKG